MRLRYRIPLIIIAILIVFTTFIGSSYSFWEVTEYQTDPNIIRTGCFELSFEEQSSSVNLVNSYPMADEKGLKTIPYTFTLTNTCDIDADYTVYLNTFQAASGKTKIDDKFIKYSLNKKESSSKVAKYLASEDQENQNNKAIVNSDTSSFKYEEGKTIETSYELDSGSLKGKTTDTEGQEKSGESVTYELRLWIDSSATNDIHGQVFEAAVSTIATATDLNKSTSSVQTP